MGSTTLPWGCQPGLMPLGLVRHLHQDLQAICRRNAGTLYRPPSIIPDKLVHVMSNRCGPRTSTCQGGVPTMMSSPSTASPASCGPSPHLYLQREEASGFSVVGNCGDFVLQRRRKQPSLSTLSLPGCSASPHSPWCQYYSQIHT